MKAPRESTLDRASNLEPPFMTTTILSRALLAAAATTAITLDAHAQRTYVEPLAPSELQFTVGGVAPSAGYRVYLSENFGVAPEISQADLEEDVRRCKAIAAANPTQQVYPPSPAPFDLQFTINAPPPGAAAAIANIEAYYESILTTTHASGPIQITVNFGALGPTTGMNTSSTLYSVGNSAIQANLSFNNDGDDLIQSYVPVATVPVQFSFGGPVTNSANILITAGTLVGVIPSVVPGVTGPHSVITVNTAFTWDYDPTNGVTAGQVCFRTAFAHEIGHALGFNSAISIASPTIPTQLDMFRFQRSANTATGFGDFLTRPRLVHLDTPNDDHELSFVYAHYPMEDGNPSQASHFRDQVPEVGLMDPTLSTGVTAYPNYLQTSDLRVLDALGFDWNDPELLPVAQYRVEAEPNSTKANATAVTSFAAGQTLIGTSNGFGTTPADTTIGTVDDYRLRTSPLPLGIYRHTLTLSGPAGLSLTASIRGLSQLNGVIGTTDISFQSSVPSGPSVTNSWYGFGKQEEVFYQVVGSGTTTLPYSSTLSTTTISPILVPGSFFIGPITVSSVGVQTTDTEIYVYDSNLNPVPLGHNDDPLSTGGSGPSLVTVNLSAGTYYVAIGTFNTANNQSDLNPDEFYPSENVLDFPDVVANTDNFGGQATSFRITDGFTTTPVTATHTNAHDISWARFTVAGVPPPTAFCFGDGSGTACPCGNSGIPGRGCANSVSAVGALLTASGVASATLANDTLLLSATGVPNGPGLYFQGTTQLGAGLGTVFGDGLRCAGGSVIRLGIVMGVANASTYPSGAVPPNNVRISQKGFIAAGNVRQYQLWYRDSATYCTASVFNLTNGMQVTWGP